MPFQLSEAANVTLSIYDVAGKLVRTLELGQKLPGYYLDKSSAAYWDGRNSNGERMGSGVYFYSLRAGDFTAVRRMVLQK
ncbi:T9SS type A sorting domain-containing protein [Candidatus Poribacteria bacterium]|nr:T9SS type A sorting domain-containing protein [Candidatus Poribacteria bacterium]